MTSYTPVIGLEVHVQLDTRTKLFCGDAVTHDAKPNSAVCPVCLGLPGALPVLNVRAVELALRAAALFGCHVHEVSRFVRKNYFYPDLPKGYQITQLHDPLATGGMLEYGSGNSVALSRMHVEEDAGKLLHDRAPGMTLIDLNRCGIPLLEIVTEPQLHSAEDAANAARALRQLIRYAGISDCDMELGSLRIDANVSLKDSDGRTEIKNINSFAQLERAIRAEIDRQSELARSGAPIGRSTAMWDADGGELRVMRSKEERGEYRYFDEPDLPPLRVTREMILSASADLPETPSSHVARYETMGLPRSSAAALAASRPLAEYFDSVVELKVGAHAAAAWILTHVLAWCNANHRDITEYPVTAGTFAGIVSRAERGVVTRDGARALFVEAEHGAVDLDEIAARLGLSQSVDAGMIAEWIEEIVKQEPDLVARYRAGESNLFGFFMGKLMSRAGAAADPGVMSERLRTRLDT